MKLAEALLLRADLQKKLASLRVEFGYSGNELENRNQREYNLTRGSPAPARGLRIYWAVPMLRAASPPLQICPSQRTTNH